MRITYIVSWYEHGCDAVFLGRKFTSVAYDSEVGAKRAASRIAASNGEDVTITTKTRKG